MTSYETPRSRQEVDPNCIIESHLKGLRNTSEAIKDFRMVSAPHARPQSPSSPAEYRKVQSEAAADYLESLDQSDPKTRMYAALFSTLPKTVTALSTLKNADITGHQRYNAKLQMATFNDSLRTIIDTNPHVNQRTLLALVQSTMMEYRYTSQEINATLANTNGNLTGMKHELAVEAPLCYLPEGYELMDTTPEDDKRGIDYKVRCRSGAIVTIDVKANQELADKAIEERCNYSYEHGHGWRLPPHRLILASGFTESDFKPENPWRVTPEAVERVYPTLEKAIFAAAGDTARSETSHAVRSR